MSDSRNNLSLRYILFYLSWTITFTIIPIVVVRPEKLTFGMIFFTGLISAIISIPATYFFFKVLNRQTDKSKDLHFDLLPEEKIILKTYANFKKNILLLGGVLLLTDKHIIFIGTEFFNRNKRLIHLPLNLIVGIERVNNNQLTIKEDSGKKYMLLIDGISEFQAELKNALK